MSNNTRILFNKDFYAIQGILSSNKFNRMFANFRREMELKGLPFPSDGFKTVKEYHEWSTRAHENDIYYEDFIDSLIEEFSLKKESKEKFQLGLQWFIYFDRKKAPIKFTNGKLINVSNDNQSVKVELTVYPWTIKKDIIDGLWKEIEAEQQKLVEYKSGKRNREWETFDRDFKIYELFLNIKKENPKSVYRKLVEHPEFTKIINEFKHGKSLDESIGTIITRCKRNLSELNLI